jgi:hypothetical protein
MKMKSIKKQLVSMFVACAMAVFSAAISADMFDTTTQSAPPQNFNHAQTGFPLSGLHASTECGACHVGGIFKGTPRNCSGCHSKGRRVTATTMPANHVQTNDPCETCHTNTVTFLGARINHGKVSLESCTQCHNGIISTGRPSNHAGGLRTTESCGRCHRTYAWIPANFNHTGVTPKSCATQCHNGVTATGRPAGHTTQLKSTSSCDVCHRYTGWYPTFYDHSSVASGSCTNCHNGVEATRRPSGHSGMKATLVCDQCHTTYAWSSAGYNHSGVASGSCATCHNGSSATAKPASHTGSKATMTCDQCHTTTAWLPAAYNHSGIARGTCLNCHLADRPAAHATRGYTSSCDNCHQIGSSWVFNHALQQGQHTCNSCHARHHNDTPCDYCHSVYSWGG